MQNRAWERDQGEDKDQRDRYQELRQAHPTEATDAREARITEAFEKQIGAEE